MNKKKIVAIGGGSGLATLLRGIKKYQDLDIIAVVSMMDDGGSSGRLSKEFGIIPPGDVRNCLLALSTKEDLLTKLFDYRFPVKKRDPQVGGHSLGNLLLLAISDILGGFDNALKEITEILSIRGKVIPVTLQTAKLVAELEDGTVVEGETKISSSYAPIKKLTINPKKIVQHPETVKNILSCDVIIVGPGSLFTSVIPHFILSDISKAISVSKAKKIYIANIMTQPGETDNYKLSDHLNKIYEHCSEKFLFDYVVVNNGKMSKELLEKYSRDNSFPVKLDFYKAKKLVKKIVVADVVSKDLHNKFLRHDSDKLAKILKKLIWT